MSHRPFPWLTVCVVGLAALALLGAAALVMVALQPASSASPIPEPPLPPLEARGRAVFNARGCIQCHSTTGEPGIGPTMKDYWGSRRLLAGGGSVVADEAHFRESIQNPLARITQGYRPAMPAFGNSIAESDMMALMAYIQTLRAPPATSPAEQTH